MAIGSDLYPVGIKSDTATVCAPTTGVAAETSILHGAISELRDAIAQLGDRISPVLLAPSPEIVGKDEPIPVMCPAASELRHERGRIEQTVHEVHDLLYRLNI